MWIRAAPATTVVGGGVVPRRIDAPPTVDVSDPMFVINARRDEESSYEFAVADHLRRLTRPVGRETSLQGATERISADDLLREVGDARVLLLVHGYNTPIRHALQSFQRVRDQILRRKPTAYDAMVGFTWPAGHARYTYPWARARVPTAARHLRRWIQPLFAHSRSIDLFSYSLGTSVSRSALRDLENVHLRYIFAVAPALGVSLLKRTLQDRSTSHPYEHLYAFYSRNDATLGRWFWLMEGEQALGYSIPESFHDQLKALNVTPVNFDHVVSSHTEYVSSDALYDQVARIVDTSTVDASFSGAVSE